MMLTLVKLITKSNSSLTKKESRVLLRRILNFIQKSCKPETSCYCSTILFHSFCSLPKQNDQSRMSIWKYSNLYRKSYRNQLLLLDHFISQFLQFAETKRPIKDVHLEIFQSSSEKLPIQQTVQFNFE